ncbi:C10 family peptidase [Apibacter adventoris]|uniref:C10 family peptidase n=1 Tax=Apibacter adventoris TaxID=1679466 RepID=UPI000CF6CA03|nr:C10 family peptidase [Apibacter adventoris]PQL94038.1 hypothetical protein C4S76_06600 [Apibacter adventoris]
MFKFKSIFIVIGLLLSYYFQGQSISEETARMVANNFLNLKSENKRSQEVQLTNITAQINKKYNGFYIFKTANGQEFCIISSEKGNHPVLAYSFDSSLSTNGPISPEFLYILDGYQAANEFLRKNKSKKIISEDDALIKKEWEALLDGNSFSLNKKAKISQPVKVEPLLKTTWNQSPYYNKFVPLTYEGKSCYTGCVATAMAQIMKFWNYPVKGNGTHTYTISNSNYNWKGKTLTANFQNTTYLWNTMPNSLSSSSTEAEKDAVATLMLHVGISVDMMYGPNGSGAYSEDVAQALQDYFKYSIDSKIKYRSNYTSDTEWLNLVKDQLAKGYPVYFSGRSSTGGHAFVADGYDSNNLIHFNLGWGGYANGYYQITNPQGYTERQAVVTNIYPPSFSCSTPAGLSTSNISSSSAVLKWNASNGAQNYTVEYKTTSASTWTVANAAINSTTLTLSGLVANTAYNWRVRTNCQGSNTSDYSQANFNTLPAQIPCISNYEPNDSFAQATTISTNTNYSAGIGSTTDKDYYKFTLNSKSDVTVTLQNLPKDYDLILYNSSQAQIGNSTKGGTSNESVILNNLEPGTYYIYVYGYGGWFDITQCYNLKVEAKMVAAPCITYYEPNDSFAQATTINTNTNYSAGIGSSTDKDYYKFTLNSKSNVTVTLQNLPKDYDLILYNSSQAQIGYSTNGGTSNESITLNNLEPGTYYIYVYGYRGNFDINQCYNLKIQTTNAINKDVNIATYEPLNTENNTSVILYPNPVEDIINIKGIYSDKKEHTTLTIFDRNGSIVKSFLTKVENVISINVSDLSPNVYYLSIKGKNYKFIKK